MPVALTSTSTSPAFGPSRSIVSTESGLPAPQATAARVFMDLLPLSASQSRRRAGAGGLIPFRRLGRHPTSQVSPKCLCSPMFDYDPTFVLDSTESAPAASV